jgi:hypothetical protein
MLGEVVRKVSSGEHHWPNAHATISGNSARHSALPCDATRSLSTTSAPASRSAAAHRVALPRKNGSSVPATTARDPLTVAREHDRLGLVWRDVHRDLPAAVVVERLGDQPARHRVGTRDSGSASGPPPAIGSSI